MWVKLIFLFLLKMTYHVHDKTCVHIINVLLSPIHW